MTKEERNLSVSYSHLEAAQYSARQVVECRGKLKELKKEETTLLGYVSEGYRDNPNSRSSFAWSVESLDSVREQIRSTKLLLKGYEGDLDKILNGAMLRNSGSDNLN